MIYRLDGDGPLYLQLYRSVRAAIVSGKLEAGSRLESTRALARNAGVSRNVAIAAYDQLMAEGYLEARRGAGTFVAESLPDAALKAPRQDGGPAQAAPAQLEAPPRLSEWGRRLGETARGRRLSWAIRRPVSLIEFRYGSPSYSDFPHSIWNRIVQRRVRDSTLHQLDYGPPEGETALREELARHLNRSRGVVCFAEQVLIVNGSQQGLDLVARVLLDPGDAVVIEEPHYAGARWILQAAGAKLRNIPVDEQGLLTKRLRREGKGARLAVVTPSHQFPSGGVMPLERREELLHWAGEVDARILEDDYDSEFRYDGLPLESLQSLDREGRVLYSGTFSKVMFPALRLGYLVLPANLMAAVTAAKAATDTGTATLQQLAVADFMREGHFERHLRRMRTRHGAQRAALLEALGSELGERVQVMGANAGLHVLLRISGLAQERSRRLIERARELGVGLHSAAPFYLNPPAECELVLGYGALSEKDIREGIARLARAVDGA